MSLTDRIITHPFYSETDIVLKWKKHPDFHVSYESELNMALYAGLQMQESCKVFEIVPFNDKIYVNFFAFKMPNNEAESERFYLLFIRMMDEQLRRSIGKKYVIIYYHCIAESNYPYNFLKGVYKKLPIIYYAMLQRIYVVESSFILRNGTGIFDFSRLNKLFNKRVCYIESITQLYNTPQIRNTKIVQNLPEILKLETKLDPLRERKPTVLYVPPPPVKDNFMIELTQHKFTSEGLPIPLGILFETLKANPKFLEMEGIFRKSGSIEEQNEIIERMQKMTQITCLKGIDEYSGYAVAGVVKKFFTKLASPIVPYTIYNKLLITLSANGVRNEDEVWFIQQFLADLPKGSQRVIFHLMLFLREHVVSRHEINLMNSYNLSVCFCPCLFRAEVPKLEDLINTGKFVGLISSMFNRFDDTFKEERGSRGSKGSKGSKGKRRI